MVLKDYINYEKEVESDLISIYHYEVSSSEDKAIEIASDNELTIIINIGNIINVREKDDTLLFPPKNTYILRNDKIDLLINKGKFSKYTIIRFKKKLDSYLTEQFFKAFSKEYTHMLETKSFIFDFPLNIDILIQLEDLYKTDYTIVTNFNSFEIESKSHFLLYKILKKILFMDYKYLDSVATSRTKYYAVIKNIIDNQVSFEDSLFLYNMDTSTFLTIYESLTKIPFEIYYKDYLNVQN